MPIVREGQAPYPPTSAVMTVIEGYRTKHPQTPFTVDNIQPLGVQGSLAPRTLQALRLLDLVDDTGEPTPAMNGLREATRTEFPERLAEVVRAAYPEVFSYKDPATDSPEELVDVFRRYRPQSMRPRMMRLFYGLCAEAGIIESAPAIGASGDGSNRKSPSARNKREQPGAKAGAATSKPTALRVVPPVPPSRELPEIVGALVAKLPRDGESWTADDAAWWLKMAEMAFPREYGFEPASKGTR